MNPYQSPGETEAVTAAPVPYRLDKRAIVAWPVLFLANIVIPLLLGWSMTQEHGRAGMFLALFLFLCAGWMFCSVFPWIARRLLIGSLATAISQVFPVLQIVSGIVAYQLAMQFGWAMPLAEDKITSEIGGFVVTTLVGAAIAVCAFGIGAVLALILPTRWIDPKTS